MAALGAGKQKSHQRTSFIAGKALTTWHSVFDTDADLRRDLLDAIQGRSVKQCVAVVTAVTDQMRRAASGFRWVGTGVQIGRLDV